MYLHRSSGNNIILRVSTSTITVPSRQLGYFPWVVGNILFTYSLRSFSYYCLIKILFEIISNSVCFNGNKFNQVHGECPPQHLKQSWGGCPKFSFGHYPNWYALNSMTILFVLFKYKINIVFFSRFVTATVRLARFTIIRWVLK